MKRLSELFHHFPALRRLGPRRSRSIPVVRQMSVVDCGAACLCMVLGYHGRETRLDDVRKVIGIGRDGSNALALLNAARSFQLRGRGIKIANPEKELAYLPSATVLHWEFHHFVVFEGLQGDEVGIIDPSMGRMQVSRQQFNECFTGVALLFEPTDSFQAIRAARGGLGRHLRWFQEHLPLVSRILFVSLLLQLFTLSLPLLTGVIVDRLIPHHDTSLLTMLGLGIPVFATFQFLTSLVRAHLMLVLRTRVDAQMTMSFMAHLLSLPFSFFQLRTTGDLMMRLGSNANIREVLTSAALSGLLDGVLAISYLLLILLADVRMGGVVFALALLQAILFVSSQPARRALTAQSLVTQSKVHAYLVHLLSGVEALKSAGAEDRAMDYWTNLYVDDLNVAIERGRLNAIIEASTGALRLAAPLIVLYVGALSVLQGRLGLGEMLALSVLANGFLIPFSNILAGVDQLQLLKTSLERIDDILDTASEQDRDKVSAAPRLSGHIRLENVSFQYSALAPLVVQKISVDVEPGQTVAIVGHSGSGKSTLARLLLGLYRPTTGRILFDDIDVHQMDARSVRAQMGVVPQRPWFLATTVRENISLSDPSLALQRVIEAARFACIHEEIMSMPMGYDTVLVEGAGSVSGGQGQRMALARALVTRPSILLLDEATSALDTIVESKIQSHLDALRCTRIIIAHRLSSVAKADKILVMSKGELVEQGTHEQLLAMNGQYARLIAAQVKMEHERVA